MTADSDHLDVLVIVGLLFLLGAAVFILAFVAIPDKNQDLFSALVGGVIGASIMSFINNRFGSSKGSATKDATIATLAANQPDPSPSPIAFDAGAPTPKPDPNFPQPLPENTA
jgi:hypothetical protein